MRSYCSRLLGAHGIIQRRYELPEYNSAQEYFEHISQEISPDQATELEGLFSFDIQGAGLWTIEFTDSGEVVDHCSRQDLTPDCTIISREKDWLEIVSGRIKPMSAFITGKLKVEGSTGKAMKLQKVLGQ